MELRGHHLICLQFYHGEGYNEEFIEKLDEVIERAKGGEKIEIVYGTDEVCRACPYLKDNECNYSEDSKDEIYELDNIALNLLKYSVGEVVYWDEIKEKVAEIINIWRDKVCKECEWRSVCESYGKN